MKDQNIWLSEFENLRTQILNSNDKLKNNYSKENLNILNQEEATVILDNNKIVAFSFLQNRMFWGNISRIFSRMFIVPNYRKNIFKSGESITDLMYKFQIEIAQKKGRDFVFISRNYPIKKWSQNFISKYSSWTFDQHKLYKVCQSNGTECMQYCLINKLTDNNIEFPLSYKLIDL